MANDGPGNVDLNMEGGDPIRPRPEEIKNMNAQFDTTVDAEVERRTAQFTAERDTAVDVATKRAAQDTAISTLRAMIAGNPGDTVETLKFRGAVQDMVLAIHAGSDKPPAEYVAEAMRLSEARVQQLAATSGDNAGDTLGEVHADNRGGYQTFAGAYMGSLFNESKRLGESLDGEKLTGSPEMEYASTLLDKPGMK